MKNDEKEWTKTMKNDENERKNKEAWWKIDQQQWKMMKKREKTVKNDQTYGNKQWKWWKIETKQSKLMKNRETQMKNYEKEKINNQRMMKKRGKNNEQWWKIVEKIRKHDEK